MGPRYRKDSMVPCYYGTTMLSYNIVVPWYHGSLEFYPIQSMVSWKRWPTYTNTKVFPSFCTNILWSKSDQLLIGVGEHLVRTIVCHLLGPGACKLSKTAEDFGPSPSILSRQNGRAIEQDEIYRSPRQGYCNILQDTARYCRKYCEKLQGTARDFKTQQETARFCKVLQDTAKYCKGL